MRTEIFRRGFLLIVLLIWSARPIIPTLIHPGNRAEMDNSTQITQMRSAKDRLPENPLSTLHEWLASTETTLKTLPIKDKENFLQHLETMKGNFAKLIQRPLKKMNNQGDLYKSTSDLLQGPDGDRFYQGLETLYKEKIRLENNIIHNLETYGLKV
ncbi:MAG: hypothetical protein HYV97_17540 [Bdellovibrio sp.]|nr:hypothetical protein [Bdellovibrio sp.]